MEIRAIDIRIGNLLMWEDESNDIVSVVCIYNKDGIEYITTSHDEEATLDEFIPVPITEERLLKYGFVNNYRQFDWTNWGMYVEKGLEDEWIVCVGFANIKQEVKTVKYIHKLQNIYYEYSDEELTAV